MILLVILLALILMILGAPIFIVISGLALYLLSSGQIDSSAMIIEMHRMATLLAKKTSIVIQGQTEEFKNPLFNTIR